LEEGIASIFRVEEYFSKPVSKQVAPCTCHNAPCHLLARWFAELFFDPED
jgi:hypothetical protein